MLDQSTVPDLVEGDSYCGQDGRNQLVFVDRLLTVQSVDQNVISAEVRKPMSMMAITGAQRPCRVYT
jgi:hypothetical protein